MKIEVEALFHTVADLSPEERELYYRVHRIEAELRAEVEQLLRFDGSNTLTGQVSCFAQQILEDKCGRVGRQSLRAIPAPATDRGWGHGSGLPG
jgi:hypothetical protein